MLALASVSACASGAFERAALAEQQQDYDRAVVEYTQALKERPETRTRDSLSIAPGFGRRKTTFNAAAGSRPSASYEEALLELQLAAELNPSNGGVEELLRSTRLALRNKIAVSSEGKTKLETSWSTRASPARPGSSCRRTSSSRHRSCSATPAAATS